jgi:uroporphyrinogen III methyltransferase / synthase
VTPAGGTPPTPPLPAGMVHLVGAGPGDPELITVRGRDLLAGCDAVVLDALASPLLLAHLRPGAEVFEMGKRAGQPSATQAEIGALLVRLAREGRRVVRLKGGDPFVFGRGGEECELLEAEGIPYEVVPGVTSAVAAPGAAGIPVTHRDWAGHVTVVTGHERGDADGSHVDLAALAGLLPDGTLVFLMGARSLPRITAGLLAAGADPATPAASVQWGTDPRQRSCSATLATIADAVAAAEMGAPMVTVIGRVAALRDRLGSLGRRPLSGRRILVTRARAQASGFVERLRRLGAEAVELPVIAVEPVGERRDLEAAARRIAAEAATPPPPGGRHAVFTSANAVRLVWEAVRAAGLDARCFAGMRLVAIGPETAAALLECGLAADLVPEEYVAEAVAEAMIAGGVAGARVWLPRAAAARDVLPVRLREAGADVEVLPIYRTVLPEATAELLRAELGRGVDAVTFTSSSTVTHFREALGGSPFPAGAVAACIGPVTARTAREAGYPVAVVATEYTTAGLAAALSTHFTLGTPASLP